MRECRERVFLIDDDPAMHRLVKILVTSIGLEFEGYEDPLSFLNRFEHRGPGVIVSDWIMPGMTGLELMHLVHQKPDSLPFILVTGNADVELAISAFRSGAFDFFEKPFSKNAFVTVIQRAIDRSRSEIRSAKEQREISRRIAHLTSREAEVAWKIATGSSNKEMARILGISPRTVEHHRQSALNKLGVHSVAELCAPSLRAELNRVQPNCYGVAIA